MGIGFAHISEIFLVSFKRALHFNFEKTVSAYVQLLKQSDWIGLHYVGQNVLAYTVYIEIRIDSVWLILRYDIWRMAVRYEWF